MREMEDAIGLKDNDGGVLTAGQLRAIERNEVKRLSCISPPSRSLCLPGPWMGRLGVFFFSCAAWVCFFSRIFSRIYSCFSCISSCILRHVVPSSGVQHTHVCSRQPTHTRALA